MKSLVIALSVFAAAPAFASQSSCITSYLQQGYFMDQAQALCSKSATSTCNVSVIMAKTGLNYASAASLCPTTLESNAAINECVAQGNNYATCAQNN